MSTDCLQQLCRHDTSFGIISILGARYHCGCVLSRFSHVWLFVTLWTVAHQSPLSMGFSRQIYWSGLLCPPPGDLPDPGIEPASFKSPALAVGFFTPSATREAPVCGSCGTTRQNWVVEKQMVYSLQSFQYLPLGPLQEILLTFALATANHYTFIKSF